MTDTKKEKTVLVRANPITFSSYRYAPLAHLMTKEQYRELQAGGEVEIKAIPQGHKALDVIPKTKGK